MVFPYLLFEGNCREAMVFYERALEGQKKSIITYESYTPYDGEVLADDKKDWILHGEMEISGQKFWFADELEPVGKGNLINLVLCYQTKDEAMQAYENLKEDGEVIMEPMAPYYGPMHAVLKDRYGVVWNVLCES